MAEKTGSDSEGVGALLRFWTYLRPHKRWLVLGMLMIPAVAGMATLRPLLLKEAVDVDIPAGDALGLRVTAMLFLGAVVAEFIAQAVQVYALQRSGHLTICDLRRAVFSHVIRLPARFFDRHPLGSLLSRSTSDIEALSETLSFGVFTILTDVVVILATLGAMFYLDAVLTLISLAVAPVLYVIVRFFSSRLRHLQLEVRRAQGAQSGFLAEQLTGVSVVQLYGREAAAVSEYERLGGRYLKATRTANIYDALLYALMDGISALCIALMIYYGAPRLTTAGDGALTLGLLFAFVDYLQRVFVPIREFSGKLAVIQRALAALSRVYGLLDQPAEARTPAGAPDPLAGWRGGVTVRDLRFRYVEGGPEVLRGISFDVAPGEVVAVVGRTGSGKTSLGRVLTRTYDDYEGSVTLDAPAGPVEVRALAPDALRRHILMVQQDVFLFADDVAFNVALGEEGLADDPARLTAALETVEAQDFVSARGGLTMEVGERGRNLSSGEAQLIAFARVAARQPTLLILDEATASVDSMTEHKVQAAIERLLEGRSVLVIAHRLSTVRRADKILVLGEGEVVELGTHDQLMARGGVYAELYQMGFDDDAEPPASAPD
ncbi:MAG: ABC transporter ATP-binding protein [Nannocystaceae bacterium]